MVFLWGVMSFLQVLSRAPRRARDYGRALGALLVTSGSRTLRFAS